ncbi:MAG: BLUF domain-containing protein [Methylobacterium sp.]|nr:BLUF domain-containing protein [Methylobacterium sp.]MCA3638291.1 BLUF domain-containing protein [Methylobacterium sp.]
MITQLVYTSSATFDPASEAGSRHIAQILETARGHNSQAGLSGFLLVGGDWFAQVLEGEAAAVTGLFRRILFDHRHMNVRLIETRAVRERLFGEWSMGSTIEPLYHMPLAPMIEARLSLRLDFPFDRIIACALREAQRLSEASAQG